MQFLMRLPHVTARLSERADGPMGSSTNPGDDGKLAANRSRYLERYRIPPAETVMAGLVHGTDIAVASEVPPGGRVPDRDGVITFGPAAAFGVGDCFPLYLAPLDPSDGRMLAAIAHAGWRGILNGIARAMVEALAARGVDPLQNLAVAIGPGIGECCFTVRDDERGVNQYCDHGYGAFVKDAGEDEQGKLFRVDLLGILRSQLSDLGIPETEIEIQAPCTYCTRTRSGRLRFFSWRRDRVKGNNMLAVIHLNRAERRIEAIRL